MTEKPNIENLVNFIKLKESISNYIFVSLGHPLVKAQVKILKNINYLENDLNKLCQKFKNKSGKYPTWVKLDIVTSQKTIPFHILQDEMINTRRNYIDFGISLDKYWNVTFLPEEINA
ncbi:TPA: hypothetical protein NBI42_002703, partial [Staphylococcus aureus]|nr:hypothetical protein [Staphylococcus aureus]HCD1779042.1 hypothetical protein [Staphylococcus aureus]HCD3615477.1 hypothetical protein [Staphylococcus aureus]HCZ2753572.1 hypothetical protein [Staphylococcus aureus]